MYLMENDNVSHFMENGIDNLIVLSYAWKQSNDLWWSFDSASVHKSANEK